MAKMDLGNFLREARMRVGFSQGDVAQFLGLNSAQSVSDWERNYGSGIPVGSLKKLVKLYKLDADQAYKLLLDFQLQKVERSLKKEFFKRGRNA